MVPTFNEKENIGRLIKEILALPLGIEILVVDDNSPDGTGDFIDQLAKKNKRIHILHRLHEKGRASAGISGFKWILKNTKADLIIEMDADFSHDPKDIPKIVQAAEEADVGIGSRYVPGGKQLNCLPKNILLSRIINFFNWYLLGVPVHDASGGFKCYRRKVLETINLDNFNATAYSVGVETLLKCQAHGFTFKEVPITFVNRRLGKSKANFKVLTEYPLSVCQLWFLKVSGQLG